MTKVQSNLERGVRRSVKLGADHNRFVTVIISCPANELRAINHRAKGCQDSRPRTFCSWSFFNTFFRRDIDRYFSLLSLFTLKKGIKT